MDKAIGNGYTAGTDSSWAITRFFREEVFDPKKIGSNLGVVYGVSVFAGAVYFLENFGELLVA